MQTKLVLEGNGWWSYRGNGWKNPNFHSWVVIIHSNTFLYGEYFLPIVNANGVISLMGNIIATSSTSIAIATTFVSWPSIASIIILVPFVPKAK